MLTKEQKLQKAEELVTKLKAQIEGRKEILAIEKKLSKIKVGLKDLKFLEKMQRLNLWNIKAKLEIRKNAN